MPVDEQKCREERSETRLSRFCILQLGKVFNNGFSLQRQVGWPNVRACAVSKAHDKSRSPSIITPIIALARPKMGTVSVAGMLALSELAA